MTCSKRRYVKQVANASRSELDDDVQKRTGRRSELNDQHLCFVLSSRSELDDDVDGMMSSLALDVLEINITYNSCISSKSSADNANYDDNDGYSLPSRW